MDKLLHGNLLNLKCLKDPYLAPHSFFIYRNDLPDKLKSNCKLFADDTFPFNKVLDKHVSRATLKKDLELINNWTFQWKMQFNPD